jgi:DNA-binding Lrp family transcriptional regulator
MLRPQEVLVSCKLLVVGRADWTFASLAESLGMSPSEVHASVGRARAAGLLSPTTSKPRIVRSQLLSLVGTSVHDVFFARRGAVVAGMPTATSAPCLQGMFPGPPRVVAQVWPCATLKKPVSGESLAPLYPSVPEACRRDGRLYRLMALVDVVRVGEPAEQRVAVDLLRKAILRDDYGEELSREST